MDLKTIARKYNKNIMTAWRNFKKVVPYQRQAASKDKHINLVFYGVYFAGDYAA
jgi:hypothetical protein